MAIDLDAIRKRLNGLQNKTSQQNNLWKPEPGKQVVRIVPYTHNKDNPFVELFFHYNLGQNKTFMSPMSFKGHHSYNNLYSNYGFIGISHV